ncbi:hypothetical protein LB503_012535 [Fusarium chuoi]|nr:hypothetical protein LB503_012535 [Fusarium chuoi]
METAKSTREYDEPESGRSYHQVPGVPNPTDQAEQTRRFLLNVSCAQAKMRQTTTMRPMSEAWSRGLMSPRFNSATTA